MDITDTSHIPSSPSRPLRGRLLLAAVGVIACLPYLVLKLAWLTGSTVGLNDVAIARSGVMETANILTAVLEAVAGALAITLATRARWRLPSGVLALPLFVGTGLLGGILLLLPVEAVMLATHALPSAPPGSAPDPIQGWVYAMVYGGFSVLGLCLLTLFALHARERWLVPGGWTTRVSTWPSVAGARRTFALVSGVVMLAACLSEAGIALANSVLGAHQVVSPIAAVISFVAGLALVTRAAPGTGTRWLVAAFGGAAVVASWGAFFSVLMLVPNPLAGDTSTLPSGLVISEVARAVAGVCFAVAVCRLGRGSHADR